MTDLAAIVARDAAYNTMNVVLDEAAADGSRGGRMQMAADRRALLALLRESEAVLDALIPYTPQACRYIGADAARLLDAPRGGLRRGSRFQDRLAAVGPAPAGG